jgi:predicted transcriptional regulator
MTIKGSSKSVTARKVKAAVTKEPGLTIKDLAERLDVNRQFMAGFLAALEERGEISCRKVGPARIYFKMRGEEVHDRDNPGQ